MTEPSVDESMIGADCQSSKRKAPRRPADATPLASATASRPPELSSRHRAQQAGTLGSTKGVPISEPDVEPLL